MGKKTAKSKTFRMFHRKRANADLSFNNFQVKFGNRIFVIEGLSPQFKQTFIFLYKYRKLTPQFYNEINRDLPEQKVYITQLEAYSLILNGLKTQSAFQNRLRKIDQQMIAKIKQKNQFIDGVPNQTIENKQLRQKIQQITQMINQKRAEIQADLKQCQRVSRKSEKQQQVLKYLKKVILRKEKDLFVKCIIMIIQCQQNACPKTKLSETKCIVVLEQCFPQKYYDKTDLIQMIGIKNYDQKVTNFYQYSQKYFNNILYNNCNFIVCHQCMQLISTEHKKQIMECQNIIQTRNIRPESYNDPNMFYQRILKSNFNTLNQRQIQFGYNSYYRAQDRIVQFKCNRYLCRDCAYSKTQKGIDLSICDFCTGTCQCQKCKEYRLLVRFLGNYRNMGGNLQEFQKKFIFKYTELQKRKQRIRHGKFQKFPHLNQMKNFYESLTKIKNQIQIQNQQKQNTLKIRGNLAQKKSYEQISYFRIQNFRKNQNHIRQNSKNIQKNGGQFSLYHPDTKDLKQKVVYLIPQRQKKRQLMQKKRRKQLQNIQKDQYICSYLTNQELKQVIQKDSINLIKTIQNEKILLKQIPALIQNKDSKKIAIRPKTKAQKQKDQFYEQKLKIQNSSIKLKLKMPNYKLIRKDSKTLQSELFQKIKKRQVVEIQDQQENALNDQFDKCDFQDHVHTEKVNIVEQSLPKANKEEINEKMNEERKQSTNNPVIISISSSLSKSKVSSSQSSSEQQSEQQSSSKSQSSSQSQSQSLQEQKN